MKLKKLIVEGFEAAAQRVEIDFDGKNMIAFIGENGSGKSMLSIWAPVFALFGKVRTRTITEAISTSAGQAYVEMEFYANGNLYRVIRKLPRIGRQEAVLYVFDEELDDWEPLTEKEVKSTNASIIEVIGMDYESARTTFIAEQGQYGLFCEGKPSERRAILTQLLSLHGYEELKDAADEKFKAAALEISGYTGQLDEIDNLREIIAKGDPLFANMTDEDLESELESLHEKDQELQKKEAEFAFQRENAQRLYEEARGAVQKFYSDKESKVASIERNLASTRRIVNPSRIRSLEAELEKIEDSKLRLRSIGPQIDELNSRVEKGKAMISTAENELEAIQNKATEKNSSKSVAGASIKELDQQEADLIKSADHGAQCTTCRQPLSDSLLETVLLSIRTNRNELNQQMKNLDIDIESLRNEYRNHKSKIKKMKDYLDKYTSDLSSLMQNKAVAEQVLASEQRVRMTLEETRIEQNEAMSEITALEEQLNQVRNEEVSEEMNLKVLSAQRNLENVNSAPTEDFDYSGRSRIAELEKELAHRDTVRAKEAAFDARHDEIAGKLTHARKDEESYGILRKAFAPTGIPAMIMAGALQELEDDANVYLDKFSKGALSLNIETQKETQKGKINEEILVTINAPDGTREYASFSGGQKFRIDLSIRIAMCKVSARRSGTAAVETFFIDEGFGALDDAGKLSTLAALTELSEEMSIISVSHIDSVKSGFPNLIEVSLDSGTTTVKELTSEPV